MLLCFAAVMAIAEITPPDDMVTRRGQNTSKTPSYSAKWEYWSQGASADSTVRDGGCRVVSETKAMVEMGIVDPSVFNPDDFWKFGRDHDPELFASGGDENGTVKGVPVGDALIQYAQSRGYEVEYSTCSLSGQNTQAEGDVIMDYLRNGYVCMLNNSFHTVYVLRSASLAAGEPVISDTFTGSREHRDAYHAFIGYTSGEYAYKYSRISAFRLKHAEPETGWVGVTKDGGANIRTGYFDHEKTIYKAPRGSWYEIVGRAINSHGNEWFNVKLPDGRLGWIYSGNVAAGKPETKRITNVNAYLYAPVHSDFYGKADTIIRANQGDAVTVFGKTVNSYGNTWYLVQMADGIHKGSFGWMWSEYFSGDVSSAHLSNKNTYYVIADPEAGTPTLGPASTCFNVGGAQSYTVSSGFSWIDSFDDASAMKTITIPVSIQSIRDGAFSGCTSLTTVYYQGTSEQWNKITIGSGNENLKNARLVCQGNAQSAAAFSSVSATPATTNAVLRATVAVTNGSGTFTGSGIRVYRNGSLVASKDEKHSYYRSASGSSNYNIWYDVTAELGKTLSPGTTYTYQFYTVFNKNTIWSDTKSFTTAAAASVTFNFSLENLKEDAFTFSFKCTANKWGIYSEFGHTLTDMTAGSVVHTYSNTSDANLGSNSGKKAQWFSINSWTPYSGLRAGHTYGLQLYFVFDKTTYTSDVYTFRLPDQTAPSISNVRITNVSANGYTVSCKVKDNNRVSKVQFPTWSARNGQDDLVWHDGIPDGDVWSYTVNTHDGHGGDVNCLYTTHIYAWDDDGNYAIEEADQYLDSVAPVISDVRISDHTLNSYTVSCTVTDDAGVNRVKCYSTNTLNDDYTNMGLGSSADHEYSFRVYSSNFSGAVNCFYSSVITAFDACGNQSKAAVTFYMDGSRPVVKDIRILDVDESGYTIACTVTDNLGVDHVDFSSSNDYALFNDDPGDDVVYHQGIQEGDTWSCRVETKQHEGVTDCLYFSNITAYDVSGNSTKITENTAYSHGLGIAACEVYVCSLDGLKTLFLPAQLRRIEEEAFAETAAEVIVAGNACGHILPRAFADSKALRYVVLPYGADVDIASDALDGCSAAIIYR